ncbi:MAG TPA: PHP-associated domain-containing protein, partial [Candidatus Binataceae bacterium]|nr:PHP-associated domain-containing protein [Candidatus Binataceae bacterium]
IGKAEVAGSDSHSASSVGCVTTLFEDQVADERALIEQIKARRSRAGRGLIKGNVVPFELD